MLRGVSTKEKIGNSYISSIAFLTGIECVFCSKDIGINIFSYFYYSDNRKIRHLCYECFNKIKFIRSLL